MLLVDLDNIYIINNKSNISILKKRLEQLEKIDNNIIFFGNEYTADFIKANNLKIKVNISKYNGKDSCDHELIHYAIKKKYNISIVTNDKILQKLAFYLSKNQIMFYEYIKNKLIKKKVDLKLDKEIMTLFIKSYELYKTRF